jgi:hypothetical protein
MSIKLLPPSLDTPGPSQSSEVSTSLVPLAPRAIATQGGQTALIPSAGTFTWSSSTRPAEPNVIYGTPVDDPDIDDSGIDESDINDPDVDENGPLHAEYVSAFSGSHSVRGSAVAHYLFYMASPAAWNGWRGWLINLYA